MTVYERNRREQCKDDVRAAVHNLREVLARSVPRCARRRKAVDHARAACNIAMKAIEEEP